MTLPLPEIKAITEIADTLESFLPGTPHPYADKNISFPGVAHKLGLLNYWGKGNKRTSIFRLLQTTLETKRGLFSNLILEIVKTGMVYRSNKGSPILREEIKLLNDEIEKVGFKIPDLWDPAFLDTLPSSQPSEKPQDSQIDKLALKRLTDDLQKLTSYSPQERGFKFEKLLNEIFSAFHLEPRGSFRITGEQIDGSFQIGGDTYLVEAKWQEKPTDQAELLIFQGKVEGKAEWSRGLFISYNGFSETGLEAFSKGRRTKIIGMNCRDLYFILEGKMSLSEAIYKKARRAAETGEFFVEVFDLSFT